MTWKSFSPWTRRALWMKRWIGTHDAKPGMGGAVVATQRFHRRDDGTAFSACALGRYEAGPGGRDTGVWLRRRCGVRRLAVIGAADQSATAGAGRPSHDRRNLLLPVSYTHLTLPTIY